MIIIKHFIHDVASNSVEVLWVNRTGQQDADGNPIDIPVRCHFYSAAQMDDLGADLGNDADTYADQIATVRATYTPPAPEDIAARVQAEIVAATQLRLDTFAQTRHYDGILSACTYATSSVPKFAAEGQYCVDARDATWATLYTILGEVLARTRPMPTGFADIAADLPTLAWPA